MRRTRMKDKDAHKNLKQFHADFRRAKELLENLVKREKAKKALLQLDFCLKFAKDIKDIPTTVLKQQDEFFKDWHRERDKVKQSSSKKLVMPESADDEPAVANATGGRPRGAASRPVPVVEAEPVVQPTEEGGDDRARRLEGIKRCFQSLMRNWDCGIDSPGTSLLPLSSSSNGISRMITAGAALQSGYLQRTLGIEYFNSERCNVCRKAQLILLLAGTACRCGVAVASAVADGSYSTCARGTRPLHRRRRRNHT